MTLTKSWQTWGTEIWLSQWCVCFSFGHQLLSQSIAFSFLLLPEVGDSRWNLFGQQFTTGWLAIWSHTTPRKWILSLFFKWLNVENLKFYLNRKSKKCFTPLEVLEPSVLTSCKITNVYVLQIDSHDLPMLVVECSLQLQCCQERQ